MKDNNNKRSETSSNTKTSSNGKVKVQKDIPKVSLQDLQRDSDELNRCKRSPVYLYNMYCRKEGQPVLSEDEYKEKMKIEFKKRNYPLTPSKAFNLINDINDIYKDTVKKIDTIIEKEIPFIETNLSEQLQARLDLIEKAKAEVFNSLGISEETLGRSQNSKDANNLINNKDNDNSKTNTTNTD